MNFPNIYSASALMELIHEVGFLPLLDSGIPGYAAEDIVDEECRYISYARIPESGKDAGWDWPLWKWKGEIVREMPCVYGKFFNRKAGFISLDWWADFCNYRRSKYPISQIGGIENDIVDTLRSSGSLITRELRTACGFEGKGMRSKFDAYVTRLEMATYIVTEDFVYPRDKHNQTYGWGWSLLNTPEVLYGRENCQCDSTPEESFQRMYQHLTQTLVNVGYTHDSQLDKQIRKLIG